MILRTLLVGGALLVAAGQTWAQSGKTIRIVVPSPAGGGTDVAARVMGADMAKRLGQQVIVENRSGAGGLVGTKSVVTADPDGTTVLFGYAANVSSVFHKVNAVDAAKELLPVSNTAITPLVLFTGGKLPVRTLQDLVAHAKASPPGKLNLAVQSPNAELVMHMIKNTTGITFTPVQYKGSQPATTAVLAGEADLFINAWLPLGDHVSSGRAKAILYAAPKRNDLFPDVPLARDMGLQLIESSAANMGFWTTRGSPQELVTRISRAAVASAQVPEVADAVRKAGFVVLGTGPEEQLKAHDAEVKFYTEAARLANYVPQ